MRYLITLFLLTIGVNCFAQNIDPQAVVTEQKIDNNTYSETTTVNKTFDDLDKADARDNELIAQYQKNIDSINARISDRQQKRLEAQGGK